MNVLMVGMPSDLGWDNPARYETWDAQDRHMFGDENHGKRCAICHNKVHWGWINRAAARFRCSECYMELQATYFEEGLVNA